MGPRAQLMQAVASCAGKQTQPATFKESDATGSATDAQPSTANPHEIRVSGATGSATATQHGQKDSATHAQNDEQLRVAFARTRNSQLSSLTAHRLAKEVIAAAMKRCDEFNDNDQARAQMRQQVLGLSPSMQRDLLEHFREATPPGRQVEQRDEIAESLSAANDPEPPDDPSTWHELAEAYHQHHFACKTCQAAGRGSQYGLRCGVGASLWGAYQNKIDAAPR